MPWYLDSILIGNNGLFIQLGSFITTFLIVILSAIIIAIPLVGDFALVIGAIFLPLGIAIYPLVQPYAMRALETMLTAAFQGVAAAFLLQLLLADNGPLAAGMAASIAQMNMSDGSFYPILNALQGVVAMCLLSIIVALKLPGIVAQIWGGGSLNGGAILASAMGRAATAAAGSAVGAVKGGMAAKASGGSVLGGALGGGARGATAGSQSARAISMAISGIPKAAPAAPRPKP